MITNVTQYLDKRIVDCKEKIAISDGKISLSFEEIYNNAHRLAFRIQRKKKGIKNQPNIVLH